MSTPLAPSMPITPGAAVRLRGVGCVRWGVVLFPGFEPGFPLGAVSLPIGRKERLWLPGGAFFLPVLCPGGFGVCDHFATVAVGDFVPLGLESLNNRRQVIVGEGLAGGA